MSSKRLLREFVRSVISEAAVSVADATSRDMAMYIDSEVREKSVVLYDATKAKEEMLSLISRLDAAEESEQEIDVWREFEKAMQESVVGIVRIVPNRYACHHSWYVSNVAAEKGFGPLMYDIAFSLARTLTPDRQNVTPKARGIWQRIDSTGATASSEVEALPLDDIDDPKTPPPEDDCQLHNDPVLDKAYRAKDPIDTTPLAAKHKEFRVWMLATFKKHYVSNLTFSNALQSASTVFFSNKYWDATIGT